MERWADSSRSVRFQRVRENLEAISEEVEHARDWRPVILAFSDAPERRERILRFAQWIEGDSGITTAVQLIADDGSPRRARRAEATAALHKEIREHGLRVFTLVIGVDEIASDLPVALQAHGLGPIHGNTIVLNAFGDWKSLSHTGPSPHGSILHTARSLGFHEIVLQASAAGFERIRSMPPEERRIDVLFHDDATGRLTLLFAYPMKRTECWEEARIRLLAAPLEDETAEEAAARLAAMLDNVRISAEIEVLPELSAAAFVERAASAAVVFFPFRIHDDSVVLPFELEADPEELPPVAFCMAAQDVELDADPEDGLLGDIARAKDAALEAAGKATKSEERAAAATERAAGVQEEIARARKLGKDESVLSKLGKEATAAADDEDEARRRAGKARFKAEDAARDVDEIVPEELTDKTSSEP